MSTNNGGKRPGKGKFQPDETHPRFSGGKKLTARGYVRFTKGRYIGLREHRVVIEELMLNDKLREISTAFTDAVIATLRSPPRLPAEVEVHHMDRQRAHNCPQNLLVLDRALHHAITYSTKKVLKGFAAGTLRPEVTKAKAAGASATTAAGSNNVPDWVTS